MSSRSQRDRSENSSTFWWQLAAGLVGGSIAIGTTLWGFAAERSYQKERRAHLAQNGAYFVTAMELLENRELELGDLIEFRRTHYQHWAVYIGNGKVVHFTNSGQVKIDDLLIVGEGGYCRINLLEKKARSLGLKMRGTRKEIVEFALEKVDVKFLYNLHRCNCEHFVTECFYGRAFSVQEELLDRNSTIKHVAKLGTATFPYE